MALFLEMLDIKNAQDMFTFKFEFESGLNFLFGNDHLKKTTLINIITNVLNGEFRRFVHLEFDSIHAVLSDKSYVIIENHNDEIWIFENRSLEGDDIDIDEIEPIIIKRNVKKDLKGKNPLINVLYYPHFLQRIESWDFERSISELAREKFGDFVPSLKFDSHLEFKKILETKFDPIQAFPNINWSETVFIDEISQYLDSDLQFIHNLIQNKTKPSQTFISVDSKEIKEKLGI